MTLTRLGDVAGRRPIFMLGVIMHIGFTIGLLWSTNPILTYGLIFIFGMSVTARYYVGYSYNLEMQPKSHYVLVSTSMFMFESFTYICICLYFWLVQGPWQYLQIPNLVLASAGMVFLSFMPESPRWLLSKKRFDEARHVFKWIGMQNGLEEEEVNLRLDEIVFDGEERLIDNKREGTVVRVKNNKGEITINGAEKDKRKLTIRDGSSKAGGGRAYGMSFHAKQ